MMPSIAQKLDAIAYPGLTANFDAAKSAALRHDAAGLEGARPRLCAGDGRDGPRAGRGAGASGSAGVRARPRHDDSHQFAIEAGAFGGGQAAAKLLRQANILSCGIGLPIAPVEGDVNGLRIGTPEIVRWGMTPQDMPELAGFIADVLKGTRAGAIGGAGGHCLPASLHQASLHAVIRGRLSSR